MMQKYCEPLFLVVVSQKKNRKQKLDRSSKLECGRESARLEEKKKKQEGSDPGKTSGRKKN